MTKEECKAYQKTYYLNNRDKKRAYRKRYREANAEKIYLKEKVYRQSHKEKRRVYREANKDKIRAYRKANKDVLRSDRWQRKFGLSVEEHAELWFSQRERCAICRRHQDEFEELLAVDHDHTTGEVRGLLCNSCNPCIGYAKEDITILENAIAYLNRFKSIKNI